MFIESRLLRHFDLGVLIATILIVACGLIAIYSSTYTQQAQSTQQNFDKQVLWLVFGLFLLGTVLATSFRVYFKFAYPAYLITLLLLLLVLLVGTGTGAKRWIPLGAFWIQPAEFAKIGTLLALAKYLSRDNRNVNKLRELLFAFGIVFLPILLIIRQPDLGSSLVFVALVLPMLHWAGLSSIYLFVLLAPLLSLICAFNYYSFFLAMLVISLVLLLSQKGLRFFLINFVLNIGVGISTPLFWNFLKEYQKKRILTFLGLVTDPSGLGYQVIQSKVAIGSGGFGGKGFLHGTQTHLRFLPEQHTDFILSVIGEEFGFIGVMFVLILFLFIIIKGIKLATVVKSEFLRLLILGSVCIMAFQVLVNVGMTVGIMPVTGLPLPFLSYGGSALLTNLTLIGFILNGSIRRFEYL